MKLNFRKISKIVCIALLLIIIFAPVAHVFGAINPDTTNAGDQESIKSFFAKMLSIGTGPLTAAISGLINAILAIIFLLMYFIFSPVSNGFLFPFPDQIIFNKLPFFDPNFINPNTVAGSPVYMLKDIIKNLYYTGFVIAGTVFLIAAMVIGIKLALTTIASEKAHYKQALMNWVVGIFLLFTTHFIMLIIFTVNEQIVYIVSQAANSSTIEFNLDLLKIIPAGIGKLVSSFAHGIAGIFGATNLPTDITVHGYSGLLIKFAAYAFGGDLTSSIICGILLGQTCALIIMYLKRLFYSIMLGMIAPLIVAADVMKKTM